ncbi:uncharacterized protein [Littorina saxatilis]|uniref:Uncharacterized protein n=1 Tax=Littorina saxatilis TaxID=31220 RepID=A0AAN9AV57_9CAEN
MKFVILLGLVAFAAAQGGHNGNTDHGDPLHNLIHKEVHQLFTDTPALTAAECMTKCDALFMLAAGHDEERTDKLCQQECDSFHQHGHQHTTVAN